MDMDGLSVQTVLKFINEGYIREFADLFDFDEELVVLRTRVYRQEFVSCILNGRKRSVKEATGL